MDDIFNWDISEIANMTGELVAKAGNLYNAISSMYMLMKTTIAENWQGRSYNEVAEDANDKIGSYKTICQYLGVSIPSVLTNIIQMQAANGGGYVEIAPIIPYADISAIPQTEEGNGNTRIYSMNTIKDYIWGSSENSISSYSDQAKKAINEYMDVMEQHKDFFMNNTAITVAYTRASEYKNRLLGDIETMTQAIIKTAQTEISEIEIVDTETTDIARNNIQTGQ